MGFLWKVWIEVHQTFLTTFDSRTQLDHICSYPAVSQLYSWKSSIYDLDRNRQRTKFKNCASISPQRIQRPSPPWQHHMCHHLLLFPASNMRDIYSKVCRCEWEQITVKLFGKLLSRTRFFLTFKPQDKMLLCNCLRPSTEDCRKVPSVSFANLINSWHLYP